MRHVITTISAVLMLAAFGALAQAEDNAGMALLTEVQALMKDLAENRLPVGDCGEAVQKDQKKIVDNLDALIKMILDQNAEQNGKPQDSSGSPQDPSPKPGPPPDNSEPNKQDGGKLGKDGKPIPSVTPGGGSTGGTATDGSDADIKVEDFSLLPPKEFGSTAMPKSGVTVPGYEKLLERFRITIAREAVRLPK